MAKQSKFIDYELLRSIEQYITARGISQTAFGRKAANDSMLVSDLREGREIRRKTRARIEALLAEHLPSDRRAAE